ncbi:LUD domain-containing protein [Patescibacteria group bacterium]|nr:LUD domain-containing protein [Patescibacteria group bacterium]
MEYTKIAERDSVEKTIAALKNNGITALLAANIEDAKIKALSFIPEGSEVLTMTSVTIDSLGITEVINNSGKFDSVRNKLNSMDKATNGKEMQRIGAAPDYAIGSVHAVTEEGHIVIASNTGSQLAAHVYGSPHVVLVVGTQKIVKDFDTALKRIYAHTLPLESERAKKACGVDGSFVSKLLIINREVNPHRITVIFVPEVIGY